MRSLRPFVTLFLLTNLSCQSQTDCEDLLSTKIELNGSDQESILNLVESINRLENCGLTKSELDTLNNTTVLGAVLIEASKRRKEDFTYQDIFDTMIEIRKKPLKKELVDSINDSQILLNTPIKNSSWEEAEKLLLEFKIPQDIKLELHEYILANPNSEKSYGEILIEIRSSKN